MKIDSVREFVKIAKDSGAAELKYEGAEGKISVKFYSDEPVVMQSPLAHIAGSSIQSASMAQGQSVTATTSASETGLVEITSPFVGTFYRSSSPEAAAYVKQGDTVSKGQPLCIVEAMKIMNEIESEATGEIVEICVENETYVEFGQVLFRVRP